MEQSKAARTAKRPFTWEIRSTDIGFMRADGQTTPLEGTMGCNPEPNCGCGVVSAVRPKKRRAARNSTR